MAMGASLNTPRKTPNSQMAREHEHHAQDHFAEASVETKDIAGSPQRYSRQQESHGNNESSNVGKCLD